MNFMVYVIYKNIRGEFDVEAQTYQDSLIEGARRFLEEHSMNRAHDDRRRPYDIPITPSWLVNHRYVHARNKVDRRIKYRR